jgi:hypothetical protein
MIKKYQNKLNSIRIEQGFETKGCVKQRSVGCESNPYVNRYKELLDLSSPLQFVGNIVEDTMTPKGDCLNACFCS